MNHSVDPCSSEFAGERSDGAGKPIERSAFGCNRADKVPGATGINPLAPLAANGLRWFGLVAILTGYAFVFPAGFAAFGLMAAVTSLAFVGAEVTHLYLSGRRRE